MPSFRYEASDPSGKITKGVRDALDEKQLREQLSELHLYLLSCAESDEHYSSARLKTPELADFCRQLNAMLSAGVPLVRSIGILLGRDLPARVRLVYTSVYSSLQRGLSLSEAMEKQGGFPPLMISGFKASEASGHMDRTAARMADHYEKEHRINTKIKTSAFYPLFLLGVTVVVMMLVFNFILPKFFTLFEGMELPWPTRVVMSISNAFTNNGIMLVIYTLLFVAVLVLLSRLPAVRLRIDRLKLRLPIVGRLLKIIYTSRFARTLSSLYASGLTILNALSNTRDTIGNAYIASQFDDVISNVRNGSSLSSAVALVNGFDSKLASTINVGEESGNLDYMLNSMAESFDYEADQAMTKLTALIEPVLIIIMAIFIGFIIISVMLPIMSLYQNIGGSYAGF